MDRALRSYRRATLPAPDDLVLTALTELCVLTIRRESEDDTAAYLAAVLPRLRAYPADVVLDVLRTQASLEKWRPAWAELQDRLTLGARRRQATLKHLEEFAAARQNSA